MDDSVDVILRLRLKNGFRWYVPRSCQLRASILHPPALKSASHPGRASALREVGGLSDLDNVTVRIADVAANLAYFSFGSVMNSAPRLFHNS